MLERLIAIDDESRAITYALDPYPGINEPVQKGDHLKGAQDDPPVELLRFITPFGVGQFNN